MRKRGALAAVAAAVLLAVSGCGSAEKAAGGGSGSVDEGSTQAVALTSDNFIDTVTKAQLDAETSHVDMNVDAGGQTVDAAGDVEVADDPEDTKMAMTMEVPKMGDLEMRLVDQVLYMQMGQMTQGKFAKIDLSDPNNPMGKTFGPMIDQMDPSKSLENFKGAITSFKKDGKPVEIDGVQAQPYAVAVDTSKVADALGGLGGSAAQLPDTLTYEFWIGSDNLPRKLTSDLGGAAVEMTFTKWGEDVDVEAPPASEITKKSPFEGLPSAPSSS